MSIFEAIANSGREQLKKQIPEMDTMRTALKEGFLEIGNNEQMNRVAKAFLELHDGDPYEEELGKILREYLNP